jgi:hypothetical protein
MFAVQITSARFTTAATVGRRTCRDLARLAVAPDAASCGGSSVRRFAAARPRGLEAPMTTSREIVPLRMAKVGGHEADRASLVP